MDSGMVNIILTSSTFQSTTTELNCSANIIKPSKASVVEPGVSAFVKSLNSVHKYKLLAVELNGMMRGWVEWNSSLVLINYIYCSSSVSGPVPYIHCTLSVCVFLGSWPSPITHTTREQVM